MKGNGHNKKNPATIKLTSAKWEATLMALVGDGIMAGVPEAEMIYALEKSKLGLIMAHTVTTVERRATGKKN